MERKRHQYKKSSIPAVQQGHNVRAWASTHGQDQLNLSKMKTIPGGIGLMVVASVALTGRLVSTPSPPLKLIVATASSFPIWDSFNTTIYLANDGGLAKRALPTLRVLTLGASITYGTGSDDKGGNGYRMYLRDQLRYNGHQVNMIGSRQHGSMKDNVRFMLRANVRFQSRCF